jgi:FkbM family methyltransferase
MHRLRGLLYWLLSAGPIGRLTGWLLRDHCFDGRGRVSLPPKATSDVVGAIVFGIYEYPERLLIRRWLPRDIDCIELGSSIGIISRVILQKLEPAKRLMAVEASESLLTLSRVNVAAAGHSSRFAAIHGAVHYQGDYVNFAEHGEHVRGKVASEGDSSGISTPCVTLAKIIQRNDLGSFSLVMDIEGSEFDLVARDAHSLMNCQAIVAEVHGDDIKKRGFVEALYSKGFSLAEFKHSVFAFVRGRGSSL